MPHSSTDCSPCRLDWRPSRLAAFGAAALLIGCTLALLGTRWAEGLSFAGQTALLLASLALAGFMARRVLREPDGRLELLAEGRVRWSPNTAPPDVLTASAALEATAHLHEQWPLAVVRLLPKGTTLVFWPDTLCDSGRRALRRWAGAAPEASPLTHFWMG